MTQVWSYIGRETAYGQCNPVGTVVCATVDEPSMAKSNAKIIAKWIREGLTIERVPVE